MPTTICKASESCVAPNCLISSAVTTLIAAGAFEIAWGCRPAVTTSTSASSSIDKSKSSSSAGGLPAKAKRGIKAKQQWPSPSFFLISYALPVFGMMTEFKTLLGGIISDYIQESTKSYNRPDGRLYGKGYRKRRYRLRPGTDVPFDVEMEKKGGCFLSSAPHFFFSLCWQGPRPGAPFLFYSPRYLNESRTTARNKVTLSFSSFISISLTSATRRSCNDLPALSTAFLAASSQEFGLVPTISMNL